MTAGFYNEAGRFSADLEFIRFWQEFFSLISTYNYTDHYMTKRKLQISLALFSSGETIS